MIQRIQTLWLFLATLSAGASGVLLMNLFGGSGVESLPANPSAVSHGALVLFAVVCLVSLASVFLFNNRDLQRRVILGAQYVALLGVVGVALQLFVFSEVPIAAADSFGAWIGPALAVATYVFLWLARRGVESDIKLLKSVDRLR